MQKDGVLNLNSLSSDIDRYTRSILLETGMNRLRLVVEINDCASCNCVLFLRSFLLLVFSRAVLVDVPSFVLSPTRNWAASSSPPPATTITPFGHVGGPLMGTFVRVGTERVLKGRCNRRLRDAFTSPTRYRFAV